MRDYSKVSPKFWIGRTGKALRTAGHEAQIVGFYLMTSPHANMLGLYYIPVAYIAHETGLTMEGASKGLQRACEAGFCGYDEATEVVWVFEMARYQVGDQLKPNDLRVKGVQNEYAAVPGNRFLAPFFERYAGPYCMTESRPSAPDSVSPFKGASKPLRSQEQEQEQEQEQDLEQQRAPAKPPSVAKGRRGTRLPDGWVPDADLLAWAAREHPDVDAERVTVEFADFWRGVPGQKGCKLDWPATWRNRVREIAARRTTRGTGHAAHRESASERVARVNSQVERREPGADIDGEFRLVE